MSVNNSSNRPRIRRGNNQFLDNGLQSASPPRLKTTYSEYLEIKKNLAKRLHSQTAATYDFDDGVRATGHLGKKRSNTFLTELKCQVNKKFFLSKF